jgi:hypothetical protein
MARGGSGKERRLCCDLGGSRCPPLDLLELPANDHQPRVEVDVFPGEPQHFPLAEPETERERKEWPEPVVVRRDEEALRFFSVPRGGSW